MLYPFNSKSCYSCLLRQETVHVSHSSSRKQFTFPRAGCRRLEGTVGELGIVKGGIGGTEVDSIPVQVRTDRLSCRGNK